MDVSPVQRNTQQLALANIQDYLKGNVCLKEYCKRKRFCDSLDTKLTQTSIRLSGMEPHTMKPQQGLQRNSATGFVEEVAISPASSDSAYSSTAPSPPRRYSQDPIYSASFKDNTIETTGSLFCHASTTTSQNQQVNLGVEKEPTKRKANRPSVCYSQNKRIAINGADSDEQDSARPPKKKRNRGPKPRVMYEGKGPIQLWQLILQLLVSPPLGIEPKILEWTQEEKYGFRILKPEVLAKLWGELKQKPAMNFDKLSRGLRYYYNKSMLRKVAGKENTYEFTWDVSEIIGYDPVHDTSKRLHTSDTLHALSTSTSVSMSPLTDPMNDLEISSEADSFPLSSSSSVLPVSVPVDIPVSKPQNEFAFCNRPEEPSVPVEGFWLPFLDAGDWQSVCGTDQLLEPSLIIPPPLLDFTTLIQSDQKSNFYEVL